MDYRQAKRAAWAAAYEILASGTTPTSPVQQPGETPESESSAANYGRFERAWTEVLDSIGRRAGYKFSSGKKEAPDEA